MGISSKVTIDKTALVDNYKHLQTHTNTGCDVAAVVKANGYGSGMLEMAGTLHAAGCRSFYTAQLSEAIALRSAQPNATIIVFEGPQHSHDMAVYKEYNLTLVLNNIEQFNIYVAFASQDTPLPFWLHFDTGMARLGFAAHDLHKLDLKNTPIQGYMSHLTSSDLSEDSQNKTQLEAFRSATKPLPNLPMSLANSGGIYLGKDFHFDQVRPGLALHGYAPETTRQSASGLKPILRWDAPILQIRDLKKGDTVGYGAHYVAEAPMRVATIGAGYADGYKRALQSGGRIDVGGHIAKPAGRISMDLMVIDVTHIPDNVLNATTEVCLLGPHYTAQQMADDLDTIAYEVLTSLGDRVVRVYDASSNRG